MGELSPQLTPCSPLSGENKPSCSCYCGRIGPLAEDEELCGEAKRYRMLDMKIRVLGRWYKLLQGT